MKRSGKRMLWAAGAIVVVSVVVLAVRPRPIVVETAVVVRGPLTVTIDEEGQTRVRDRYVVVSPVTGRVARIDLEPGDVVRRGAAVARVYPVQLDPRGRQEADARLRGADDTQVSAEAAVALARAALEQARRNRLRADTLAERALLSPAEREQAFLAETTAVYELRAAEARAEAAVHEVERARAALLAAAGRADPGAAIVIRAPVDGSVLAVPERSARVVVAGTTLLELGDCARLEVVVDILTTDAAGVTPGGRMLVDAWSGERAPLEARVRRVEPAAFTQISALGVEEQRVNVVADFVSDPGGLGDGFRVEARIVLWEGADVLQVPSSAIFRRGDGWSVFAVEGGRARVRDVTVGYRNAAAAEIREGLADGVIVIRHPSDRVGDGARVTRRP